MKKYEYKMIKVDSDSNIEPNFYRGYSQEIDYLNEQGQLGWELVSVITTPIGFSHPNFYYFKREYKSI